MQNRCIVLAGLMVATITAVSAHAQTRSFPPVSHSGFLGYDYTSSRSGDTKTQGHSALFNWNVASYIKQPYIAQYLGGVTLRYGSVDASSQSTSTRSIFGNLMFRVFPQSKFPFEFYLLRQSRQIDDSLGDLVSTNNTYGLMQRYTSRKLTRYVFRFENNKQTFDDRVAERDQNGKNTVASLDVSKVLGKWSFQWENEYLKRENNNANSSTTRTHSILRHTWQPGHGLSMNGFTTYRDVDREDLGGFSTQTKRVELNNSIYWRPDTSRPLTVNGNFRHVESFGGEQGSGSNNTILAGGLSYQYSDHIAMVANATAASVELDSENVFLYSTRLRAGYTSFNHERGGYRYRWNSSLGVETDDKQDEFGNVATGVAQFGHNLDRVFFRTSNPVSIGVSQGVTHLAGTDGQSTTRVNQRLFMNWRRAGNKRSSILNFNINKFRAKGGGGRFGDESQKFNLVTLVFSQTESFSRVSKLVGSLSLQQRFQQSGIDTNSRKTPSGSADITYMHRSLFNVPGLQFRTSLRWYSTNFSTSADDPTKVDGSEGGFWENRLDYRIGRLDFRLIGRWTTVNDINRNYVFFQVRRHFGGLLIK